MSEAFVIVGLGFGDEGKGRTVDHVVRSLPAGEEVTTVFYNGGCQRAHNVRDLLGQHTFSQFGSGTFAGALTHHSRFSMIHPQQLVREALHLKELGIVAPLDLVTFDVDCPVVTPFHQAANRIKELARGQGAHGTTGQGIGETVEDMQRGLVLRAGDLCAGESLLRAVREVQARKFAEVAGLAVPRRSDVERWHEAMEILTSDKVAVATYAAYRQFAGWARLRVRHERPDGVLVFEGSQGVLLDQDFGFHPHTTWSKTTTLNAATLCAEWGIGRAGATYIGVTRAYATRHGAGPLPTSDRGLSEALPDAENDASGWAGRWRVGFPDLVLFRYALEAVTPLDGLAVTCLDRIATFGEAWKVCTGYWHPDEGPPAIGELPLPESQDDQTALTRLLYRAVPVYDQADPRDMPWLFSQVAGLPVVFESRGAVATRAKVAAIG